MKTTVLDLSPDQYKVLKDSPDNTLHVEVDKLEGITKEDISLGLAVGGTFGLMLLVGGKIIGTALVLSVATIGGAIVLYIKMPEKMAQIRLTNWIISGLPMSENRRNRLLNWDWKQAMERHELAADVVISVGAVFVFGTTLSGLLSATITGLGLSSLLRLRQMYKRARAKMEGDRRTFQGAHTWTQPQ